MDKLLKDMQTKLETQTKDFHNVTGWLWEYELTLYNELDEIQEREWALYVIREQYDS